jgi:hypothetical protein
MNYLIVTLFMLYINSIDGLLFKYNFPLLNKFPNYNLVLNNNGNGGSGGNYILNSGNGGNNDDGDINFFISLIVLNIFMMNTLYKNNNIFDIINNL